MGADVQVLIDVNSHMSQLFLNAGLGKKGAVGLIED
jgi:hypothetical protein